MCKAKDTRLFSKYPAKRLNGPAVVVNNGQFDSALFGYVSRIAMCAGSLDQEMSHAYELRLSEQRDGQGIEGHGRQRPEMLSRLHAPSCVALCQTIHDPRRTTRR
jgi:hypothetical protein